VRIRNNKKHLVVNKEYSRLPYWTDDGYEDVQKSVSQKYVQDTYGAFAESENQLPYLSDSDYQGLEYQYQNPEYFDPLDLPDVDLTNTAPKGTCYEYWLSLFGHRSGAFIPTSSEWNKLGEYQKKCPLIYMPHTCCSESITVESFVGVKGPVTKSSSNIKIHGPSSVKVNETAEYTISGGLTGCAYEMGATGGTMIGGTFYAPSTAGTAEVYVKPWMSSDQNKKCDFKVVTITDEGGCDGKIGYTTLQMSTGATQELTVTGSSGGTYTWATTSGSIVPTEGTSVTYTAPATNANCASNPTITLTCGGSVVDTITTAVNAVVGYGVGWYFTYSDISVCPACSSGSCQTIPGSPPLYLWNPGRAERIALQCSGSTSTSGFSTPFSGLEVDCDTAFEGWKGKAMRELRSGLFPVPPAIWDSWYDNRSEVLKGQGCCPAQLI